MLVLDHLFILVSPAAPEADALLELGLLEGPSNTHPGQGTSNRRFFFNNTTLEFLFLHDIAEAMNGAGKELKLVERAIDIDASPFAVLTRCSESDTLPAFPYWKYQPDYFPKPMSFLVGKNSDNLAEPLCICMPPALPKPQELPVPNNADWVLTGAEISIPASASSSVLKAFGDCDMVDIRHNRDHHLKLKFNSPQASAITHIMPDIALSIECRTFPASPAAQT